MRVAALDLGTNTFLLLICEVANNKIEKIICDRVEVVRLGQGVDKSKEFHIDALKRADECLSKYAKIIKEYKPEKIFAMATSAARDVKNSDKLFDIGKKLSIPIQVISGDEEARLTFQGAISSYIAQSKNRLVIDVGGGSTEIIYGRGADVLFKQSLDIGCVRLTERFIIKTPVDEKTIHQIKLNIIDNAKNAVSSILALPKLDEILAVAGTPTELAKADIGVFDPAKIDGYILTKKKLKNWIEVFAPRSPSEITNAYLISEGRADVILVGSLILHTICDLLNVSQLIVSTRGVRYGIAIDLAK